MAIDNNISWRYTLLITNNNTCWLWDWNYSWLVSEVFIHACRDSRDQNPQHCSKIIQSRGCDHTDMTYVAHKWNFCSWNILRISYMPVCIVSKKTGWCMCMKEEFRRPTLLDKTGAHSGLILSFPEKTVLLASHQIVNHQDLLYPSHSCYKNCVMWKYFRFVIKLCLFCLFQNRNKY